MVIHRSVQKISVIIPLYNRARYICRAIESVLFQTWQDFEIIVVDDGSTDDGGNRVLEIHDERINLIVQNNRGVSAARNRGINSASNSIVAFLDADDEWGPLFLETILKLASDYPQAGAFATSYTIVDQEGNSRQPKVSGPVKPKDWEGILNNYYQLIFNEHPFNSSSISVKKEVFNEIGYFAEGKKMGEDLDMWLRIAISYPIAFSNSALSIYHQEADGRACKTYFYPGDVPLAKTAMAALDQESIPVEFQQDLLEMVARQQLFAVQHRLKVNDKHSAKSILGSIKYTKQFRRHWYWWRFWTLMPHNIFMASRKLIEKYRH